MNKQKLIGLSIILLLIFFVLTGCEDSTSSSYQQKLVINAQLVAGQPVDTVYVTWSAEITERYDTFQQRVRDAEVKINNILLIEDQTIPGAYYYPDHSYRIQSGKTYRLEVRKGEEQVSSTTTVPPRFSFLTPGISSGDTVKYIAGTSWLSAHFFTIDWFGYTGSNIFRISSFANQATPSNFIEDDRTEAKIFKGEKEDRENPSIWWVADQYARINWMYFNYIGPHRIIVSALDENYYNYRSGILFGEQTGQNFNSVVQNGYGLFASSANDTLNIIIVQ